MSGVKCLRPWHIKTPLTISRKPWALRARGTAHHVSTDLSRIDDELMIADRQDLCPQRTETCCQFGSDDEVARHNSPYDPSTTTVESEVFALREEYKREGNILDPLSVSPANLEVSRPLIWALTGPVYNLHLLGSVKGCTNKNKKVLLRTEPYRVRAYDTVFYKYITNHRNFVDS